MDCDDQVRLVKRNHNPHVLASDLSEIAPVAMRIEINMLGARNQPFGVDHGRTDVTSPILRVPCEAH